VEFTVSESIEATFDQIVTALQDPDYYDALGQSETSSLRPPELLRAERSDGALELSVRYAFDGEISGAAAMAVDASKLTWVIHTKLDEATKSATLDVTPDHYDNLLTCDATVVFEEHDGTTTQHFNGDLKVHVPLFGSSVEQAILRGFESHLAMEASALSSFCNR
jgi:hypothetical protein